MFYVFFFQLDRSHDVPKLGGTSFLKMQAVPNLRTAQALISLQAAQFLFDKRVVERMQVMPKKRGASARTSVFQVLMKPMTETVPPPVNNAQVTAMYRKVWPTLPFLMGVLCPALKFVSS